MEIAVWQWRNTVISYCVFFKPFSFFCLIYYLLPIIISICCVFLIFFLLCRPHGVIRFLDHLFCLLSSCPFWHFRCHFKCRLLKNLRRRLLRHHPSAVVFSVPFFDDDNVNVSASKFLFLSSYISYAHVSTLSSFLRFFLSSFIS